MSNRAIFGISASISNRRTDLLAII